jgi:hypothetical protein|tara:strand:+ start:9153 stop:9950 length:798 start_codon:yes stop_codon:yes gene_type:complete
MNLYKITFIIFSSVLTFSSCGTNDSSDYFWDEISVSGKFRPVSFVFSSTEIGTCYNYGQYNLEKVLKSQIQNIDGKAVNGMMLFPSVTDPLYNPLSEELKFLYDENGNQTFKSFPSFVNDMNFFAFDSVSWYQSIENNLSKTPIISLGQKSALKDDQQTIYIKGIYNKKTSSSHSIALYLFRKSKGANQKTPAGTTVYKIHKNVIYSAVTESYGKILSSKNKSEEFHAKFQFDLNNVPSSQISYLVIIYKLNDGKPVEVINSITF